MAPPSATMDNNKDRVGSDRTTNCSSSLLSPLKIELYQYYDRVKNCMNTDVDIKRRTISQDQHDKMSINNICEVYENEEYLESDPVVKEEPMSEEEAPSDLHKECMLCLKQFHTFSGLKAHVIAHHNYKTVKRKMVKKYPPSEGNVVKYTCNICKRNFTTSTDLKVHETVHDKFICFACHEKFESFQEVTQHCKGCKAKNEVVKPKTLADILRERKLQKEAMAKQENTFFECPKCMVSFRSRIHFKVHNLKCHPNISDSMPFEKENPNKMVEIEIDLKEGGKDEVKEKEIVVKKEKEVVVKKEKEVVVKNEKEVVVKKEKVEVDYKRIETELESIFKIDAPRNDIKRESNILDEADEYNYLRNEEFKEKDILFDRIETKSVNVLNRNKESKVDENKISHYVEDTNCSSGETGKNVDTESSIQSIPDAMLEEPSQQQDNSQNSKNIESREIIPNSGNNNMEIEGSKQYNDGHNYPNDIEPFTDNSDTNKDKSDQNNEEFKVSKEDNKMEVETSDNNKNVDIDNVDNFQPHICETPKDIVKIVVKKMKTDLVEALHKANSDL